MAKTLLTHKAEVNAQSEGGEIPLHLAAAWGRTPIVDLLLKAGADINSTSKEGSAPLHLAVKSRNERVSELLLSSGADVNTKDKNGQTPLDLAIGRRAGAPPGVPLANPTSAPLVNLLRKHGAKD